jgi:uncharacterized protein (DUF302 family)
MQYGFSKNVNYGFEEAVNKVTDELKKEGFGVLTSIDVKDILKKKIDVDFKKYTILGACNPALAYKALNAEEGLGLLLPCNVLVYEKENGSVVSIFNPITFKEIIDNENIEPVANEVKQKLERVLEAV